MLNISHLSAYHLTFEPGTVFDHWRKKGRLMVPEEEESLRQYDLLRQKAAEAGFEHYEISNFARNENYSQHNLLYWTGGKYLGFGPSAHSFDGNSRSWNISSLAGYINDAGREDRISEKEILTGEERYHDYLITALRTNKGADLQYIKVQLGEKYYDWFIKKAETFIKSGELIKEGTKIKMTGNSWFVADHILRALFLE